MAAFVRGCLVLQGDQELMGDHRVNYDIDCLSSDLQNCNIYFTRTEHIIANFDFARVIAVCSYHPVEYFRMDAEQQAEGISHRAKTAINTLSIG